MSRAPRRAGLLHFVAIAVAIVIAVALAVAVTVALALAIAIVIAIAIAIAIAVAVAVTVVIAVALAVVVTLAPAIAIAIAFAIAIAIAVTVVIAVVVAPAIAIAIAMICALTSLWRGLCSIAVCYTAAPMPRQVPTIQTPPGSLTRTSSLLHACAHPFRDQLSSATDPPPCRTPPNLVAPHLMRTILRPATAVSSWWSHRAGKPAPRTRRAAPKTVSPGPADWRGRLPGPG